jgi:sec-independent protein translocase protein TatC
MRLPRRLAHGQPAELVEHLGELRTRVGLSLIALAAGTTVAFIGRHTVLDWLNAPLPDGKQPITLGVTEPFTTSLKISIFAGLALTLPFILWQLWSFLAPAFDKRSQGAVARLVAFATVLLAAGVSFGYFVVLPSAVTFLTNFDSSLYDIEVRASSYYSFVMLVLVFVGIVFQLPVFLLGLVRFGVTSPAKLRRNRRTGYVGMAALAVVMPGVDPVTTALTMAPLMVLFEGSIWLAVVFERRWASFSEPEGSLT